MLLPKRLGDRHILAYHTLSLSPLPRQALTSSTHHLMPFSQVHRMKPQRQALFITFIFIRVNAIATIDIVTSKFLSSRFPQMFPERRLIIHIPRLREHITRIIYPGGTRQLICRTKPAYRRSTENGPLMILLRIHFK